LQLENEQIKQNLENVTREKDELAESLAILSTRVQQYLENTPTNDQESMTDEIQAFLLKFWFYGENVRFSFIKTMEHQNKLDLLQQECDELKMLLAEARSGEANTSKLTTWKIETLVIWLFQKLDFSLKKLLFRSEVVESSKNSYHGVQRVFGGCGKTCLVAPDWKGAFESWPCQGGEKVQKVGVFHQK